MFQDGGTVKVSKCLSDLNRFGVLSYRKTFFSKSAETCSRQLFRSPFRMGLINEHRKNNLPEDD